MAQQVSVFWPSPGPGPVFAPLSLQGASRIRSPPLAQLAELANPSVPLPLMRFDREYFVPRQLGCHHSLLRLRRQQRSASAPMLARSHRGLNRCRSGLSCPDLIQLRLLELPSLCRRSLLGSCCARPEQTMLLLDHIAAAHCSASCAAWPFRWFCALL